MAHFTSYKENNRKWLS